MSFRLHSISLILRKEGRTKGWLCIMQVSQALNDGKSRTRQYTHKCKAIPAKKSCRVMIIIAFFVLPPPSLSKNNIILLSRRQALLACNSDYLRVATDTGLRITFSTFTRVLRDQFHHFPCF
jgi:hypothetical protein